MTERLPAALKIPDVSRFINRASQLRAMQPAMAYWCEYHAVNQIVGKSLHTTDDDCFNFTKTLIERLEATKAARADDDAIVDNDAGQAYVEQFAQGVFDRAERALRANRATRQTADTFDAAATFFDLTREWGTPDDETLQKIKFAKWNAARILKALREGCDPNESNPQPPLAGPDPEPALSPDDPAVLQIINPGPQPASVEDAPDAGGDAVAQRPLPLPLPLPLPAPPLQEQEAYFPPGPSAPPEVLPLSSPVSQHLAPEASGAASPPPAPVSPPQALASLSPQLVPRPPSSTARAMSGHYPTAWAAPAHGAPPPVAPPAPAVPAGSVTNHRDMDQAQKHAKWAISALNFEDVPTAVRELQNALSLLGAQ